MHDHRHGFLDALRRQVPDALIAWRGAESVDRDLAARLQVELDRCHSADFARGFAAACPVDGCATADYLQRILAVGPTQALLVGIRFHGYLGFPFVDLLASTAPLDDVDSMEAAMAVIRADYEPFAPQAVRVLRGAHEPLPWPAGVEARVDQRIVVGQLGELAGLPAPPQLARVELQEVDDMDDAAAQVAAAYDALFAAAPAFEGIVHPADAGELRRAQERGALLWVMIDGSPAGLLATADEAGPLCRGQVVVEQVLWPEFRGRGFAAAAQRRLVERLARHAPEALLHGTIDARNHASLATARRVGRVEVAAWHWLRWG